MCNSIRGLKLHNSMLRMQTHTWPMSQSAHPKIIRFYNHPLRYDIEKIAHLESVHVFFDRKKNHLEICLSYRLKEKISNLVSALYFLRQ